MADIDKNQEEEPKLQLSPKQIKRLIAIQKRSVILEEKLQKRKLKNRRNQKIARKSRQTNRMLKNGK